MRSFRKDSTSSIHPNAFARLFLEKLGRRDEPPTAGQADVVGPWRIEAIPGAGFGLFRLGETYARGFAPAAVFPDQWLARLAAAVLPGTGQDPMLLLQKDETPGGSYPAVLDSGELVGLLQYFDEKLVDAMNVAIHLLTSPQALAYLLEAAGAAALERCGAILDEMAGEGGDDGEDLGRPLGRGRPSQFFCASREAGAWRTDLPVGFRCFLAPYLPHTCRAVIAGSP
jgi:hypothetical protein